MLSQVGPAMMISFACARALEADRVLDGLVEGLDEAAELADVEEDPGIALVHGLLGDVDDLGDDDAGVAGHGAARLDDDLLGPCALEAVVEEAADVLGVLGESSVGST